MRTSVATCLLLCIHSAASVAGRSNQARATKSAKLTDIVVFGDSISDNGRWYTLVTETFNGQNPVPYDNQAYLPYRFSNGPTWTENLATSYNATLHNFAVSGATSDNANVKGYSVTMNGKTFQTPSARDQLAQYLASNLTSFSKSRLNTTLFVVLVGGNDFFFNFLASPNSASTTVGSIVTQLRTAGATKFLLSDQYDQANMPSVISQGNFTQTLASNFCRSLRTLINTLSNTQKCAHLSTVSLFDQVLANPKAYGLDPSVKKKPCLVSATAATFFTPAVPRSVCTKPDTYIFFDGIHPTRKMHTIIAAHAKTAIEQKYAS